MKMSWQYCCCRCVAKNMEVGRPCTALSEFGALVPEENNWARSHSLPPPPPPKKKKKKKKKSCSHTPMPCNAPGKLKIWHCTTFLLRSRTQQGHRWPWSAQRWTLDQHPEAGHWSPQPDGQDSHCHSRDIKMVDKIKSCMLKVTFKYYIFFYFSWNNNLHVVEKTNLVQSSLQRQTSKWKYKK